MEDKKKKKPVVEIQGDAFKLCTEAVVMEHSRRVSNLLNLKFWKYIVVVFVDLNIIE